MKYKFLKNHTLAKFQKFIENVYEVPDDRLFSLSDLLSNHARFTMRAIKGIRKGDNSKLRLNLAISFSWLMALGNRLHINLESAVWTRFPGVCSYCGLAPCGCKKLKVTKRNKIGLTTSTKPKSLSDFQLMFAHIYPPEKRTLADAGVHLAEETGEVSEIVHFFKGQHRDHQFESIENEMADWISCLFGVANSASINIAKELSQMYYLNCHICHKAPCQCNFSSVGKFKS